MAAFIVAERMNASSEVIRELCATIRHAISMAEQSIVVLEKRAWALERAGERRELEGTMLRIESLRRQRDDDCRRLGALTKGR